MCSACGYLGLHPDGSAIPRSALRFGDRPGGATSRPDPTPRASEEGRAADALVMLRDHGETTSDRLWRLRLRRRRAAANGDASRQIFSHSTGHLSTILSVV
eukprot:5488770-Prymnesium_polylepis.1